MLAQSQRSESDALLRKVVPAGEFWFAPVARGQALRLVDLEGNEAVDTLFYSAEDTAERYSAVDTVREQGNVYLSTGSVLLSTRGNPMLEIVADTCGRHDTLAGACAGESNTVRYAHDRKCMHSCRDNWMNAIARHPAFGVTKRDVTHNINFFMNVPISEQGGLEFAEGISAPGSYVEMLARMDVLVLISNCPQLNNPCSGFNPTPIEVLVWDE